jgi:hypothetical protein
MNVIMSMQVSLIHLHDRHWDGTVVRTFPGDKGVVLDRVAIYHGMILCFLLIITMAIRNGGKVL